MTLRCFFSHDTQILTEGEEGRIVCKRCRQTIGEPWPLLRPERLRAAQRQHAAVIAERERRATAMATRERPKLVRMR